VTLDDAQALDAADHLAACRGHFQLPPDIVYLDGNSLGALPVATAGRVAELIERQWGKDLIASWNKHGWIEAPQRIAAKLAPLIGAKPNEVLVADSTSINLFKLLAAAIAARPGRNTILSETGNFPTDLYIAEGLVGLCPNIRLKTVEADTIEAAIDADTAVLMLTQVDYGSGRRHDLAALTGAAHRAGALILWDLSHSAGAIEVDLNDADCDLAVGCGYKYLNGGPGAPAFLFIAEALQPTLATPLSGWMGHADPFAFEPNYRPRDGIARFLSGTPSIIALTSLDAGLDSFVGTTMTAIEAKSRALSQAFIDQVETRCSGEVALASPRDPVTRGSHVSFAHPNGYAVIQALIARGVIGDFRAPDLMRFGFAPLYNGFEDVWRAADTLADILATRAWDKECFHARGQVT